MNKGFAVGQSASAVGESRPKFDDGCVPDKEKVLETGCTKTTTERIGGPLSCGNVDKSYLPSLRFCKA